MKGDTVTSDEKKIIRDIQKDTLFWIIRGLRTKSLSQEYVKSFAERTLDATRRTSITECFDRLFEMIDEFKEANDIFLKNARMYYSFIDSRRLITGRNYMKMNEISKAVHALKGGDN